MYLKSPTSILWNGTHPLDRFAWSGREYSSSQGYLAHTKQRPPMTLQ